MLLIVLLSVAIILWLGLRHVYTYWDRKGFPSLSASIPFGNLKNVALRKRSFGLSIYDLYLMSTEPFVGVYLFFRPALLIRDPELVHRILVDDFATFHDRGVYCNETRDPISGTLFALPGQRWKFMRQQLTPTFSSGKIKGMFETILGVGGNLTNYMKPFAEKNQVVDIKDDFQKFTLDVIANVIFGFEANTIENPKHEFRKMAKMLNKPSFIATLRLTSSFLCPQVMEFLKIEFFGPIIRKFLIKLVTTTMEYREKNNISRKDFMQLLLQIRNTGSAADEEWTASKSNENKEKALSIEQCAAQVFIFYIAGFETTSSTMSYCMYELARHPEIMKKLQDEIDSTLEKHDGKISYDSISEMRYLELCINETLRKYPSLPILNRECNRDYQIPGSNFKIEKGTGVIISVFGMHHDPEIFPDPESFKPERFDDEHRDFNPKYYIPFGDGPRNCIGFRMGKMVAKIGLVVMLKNFHFESVDNKDLKFDPAPVTLIALGGIKMKIQNR